MKDQKEYVEEARQYQIDLQPFKDINKSHKINNLISEVAAKVFVLTIYVAIGKMIVTTLPAIFSIILLASAIIAVIASIMKKIEVYRVNKYMELEYEKFTKHMASKGFTNRSISDIFKDERRD